jgi:CRP-like cAMP-binding protein
MNELGNHLLDALQSDELALLRPSMTRVRLPQGDVLQKGGAPIEHVYFPTAGMVSLVAQFESGDAIEIAAIGREGAIGTKVGIHPQLAFSSAVVQLPGRALRIDSARFQEAALKSLAVMHIATCANDVMIANLQQSAGCNAYHGVESRLARWLLQAADHYGENRLPLTQKFLSQMLGTRRTTVQLAAATLLKLGAIEYRRGKLHIKDRALLEQNSCECYRALTQNVKLICELAKVPSSR